MPIPFRSSAALLLLLAACGRGEAPPPEAVSFRQAGTPVSSTTRGTPADLAGEWVVSAAYPGQPLAPPGTRVRVAAGAWTFMPPGAPPRTLPMAPSGPGRYRAGEADLWVLWVDDDFRTAVVGTPSGAFGWVMDREGEASPDRLLAAREVLDFNGYDLARLAG